MLSVVYGNVEVIGAVAALNSRPYEQTNRQ